MSYCIVSGVLAPVREMEVQKNGANAENWTWIYPMAFFRLVSPILDCLAVSSLNRKSPTFNVFVFSGFVFVGCRQILTILVALCHAFRIQSMAELIHRTAKKFLWSVSDQAADSETQRQVKNKTNGTVKTKCDWIKPLKPSLTKMHDCWLHLVKAIELVLLGANVNSLLSLVRTNDYKQDPCLLEP